LFSIRVSADLDPQWLAGHALERRGVPRRGPQLELRVPRRPHLQQVVVAAIVQLEPDDRLCVTAIETLGEPQNRGERADGPPGATRELAVAGVSALGRRLPMIACDERDDLDFFGLEPPQVAVLHEVIRVLVVSFVADMDADVVEDRRVLEPVALAIGQPVNGARLIEQRDRQPCDLLRMLGPVVAALGQLEDAATPDVGVAIGLRDLLAVAGR
jgi:hypothetical protein